ncbi:glycerol-3-phosphate 1-O-acyltransferase PlsY [Clostridia bacterium]|nr:glycerol-3-phosphate 1-O-acyltransferase PlsY [Clostridia bacterium]
MNIFIALIVGYLLGAIPFALVIGKGLRNVDIREHGSGNLGTTNTMRTLGVKIGILVLVGDMSKGFLSAYIGYLLGGPNVALLAGVVAVVGHVYPVYTHFQGGKGVATGAGAFLFIMPKVVLIAMAVFVVVLLLGRYVSLSSMSAALTAGICATLFGYEGLILYSIWAVAIFVFYTHRSNIGRLKRHEENRVNFPKRK